MKITWPTLTVSPCLTFTSLTSPLTDEGTSTTALSVSSSMIGWPSVTITPGEIIRRTRSPCSIFSPSSGSLNSEMPAPATSVARRRPGIAVALAEVFSQSATEAADVTTSDGAASSVSDEACSVVISEFFSSEALGSAGFGSAVLGSPALDCEAAWAFAPVPFSTVKITCPTFSLSPSFTRTSLTVPLTEDGTSITALSVSSSMTDWPSVTFAPGAINRRTRSPCSMFSPNSGSLNSVT